MLRFKQYIILEQELLENRIETLKTKVFKDGFDTSHDTQAKHKDTSDIVDHFANNADPTKKKTHTQWILNQYKRGNIRQEDHPRIKEALSNFETHKGKLEKKDINQYKSLSDVEDAVEPHLGIKTSSKRQEKKAIKSEGSELVHNDEEKGVTVHHLKNQEAACSYGAGTKWCTAGKKDNMFNEYNKDGPMFVIQHGGRKYQFHNASRQFMDEKDKQVSFENLHSDIQKSLAKTTHPEIKAANILHDNKHYKPSDSDVDKLIKNGSADIRAKIAKNPKYAGKLVNDPDRDVRAEIATHAEHAGKLVNDPDHYVRFHVATHAEHAGKLVNDKSPMVRAQAATHAEHAEKLVNDPDRDVRIKVAKHAEHAEKLTNDPDKFVRAQAATHAEHAGKLVNDKSPMVRAEVAKHAEHAGKLVNDPEPRVRTKVATHAEHAGKLVNDPDRDVRAQAAITLKKKNK